MHLLQHSMMLNGLIVHVPRPKAQLPVGAECLTYRTAVCRGLRTTGNHSKAHGADRLCNKGPTLVPCGVRLQHTISVDDAEMRMSNTESESIASLCWMDHLPIRGKLDDVKPWHLHRTK
jgi:hypothetical protein